MMTGWVFVLLSAVCSVLIAHFLKMTEYSGLHTIRVLTVNYAVASLVAFGSVAFGAKGAVAGEGASSLLFTPGFAASLLLMFLAGLLFIGNFFLFSRSAAQNGLGISVSSMRLSLLIPVLISVFWYGEWLSTLQWIALVLLFAALYLMLPSGSNRATSGGEPSGGTEKTAGVETSTIAEHSESAKTPKNPKNKDINHLHKHGSFLLILLFLGNGLADTSLKIYETSYSSILGKELFMGGVFLTALGTGLVVLIRSGALRFEKAEIHLGILIGIPNLYASIFLIQALERLPGALVYSTVNLLVVAGAAVLGIKRWGDRVSARQWAGITLALTAIIFSVVSG